MINLIGSSPIEKAQEHMVLVHTQASGYFNMYGYVEIFHNYLYIHSMFTMVVGPSFAAAQYLSHSQ